MSTKDDQDYGVLGDLRTVSNLPGFGLLRGVLGTNSETLEDIYDSWERRAEKAWDHTSKYQRGERNLGEQMLMGASQAVQAAADVPGSAFMALVPDWAEQKLGEGMNYVMEESGYNDLPERWRDNIGNAGGLMAELMGARYAKIDPEIRGLTLSSAKNYIPYWYGPKEFGKKVVAEGREKTVAPKMASVAQWADNNKWVQKATPNKIAKKITELATDPIAPIALMRKARGVVGWAAEGVREAVLNLVTPSRRAMYASTGINPSVQKYARQYLAENSRKALAKAYANGNFNLHIHEQAGRVGPVARELTDIGKASNLTPYLDFEPGVLAGAMEKFMPSVDGKKLTLDPVDAAFLERNIVGLQRVRAGHKVVVKAPKSFAGGNHYNDVAYTPQFMTPLQDHLKATKGYTTPQQIADALPETKDYKVWKVEEDGVWLKGGKVGSAITEGGVMWLSKIKPSGEIMTVMMDTHDFLEKFPVVGPALGIALPTKLVAVTPPMFSNIYSMGTKTFKRAVEEGRVTAPVAPRTANNLKADAPFQEYGKKAIESMQEFANATGNPDAVMREWQRQVAVPVVAGDIDTREE